MDRDAPILQVVDLHTRFGNGADQVNAVDGLSIDVTRGEVLGIAGESGAGKTVSALSILRLIPQGVAQISGRVLFEGRDLIQLSSKELRLVRGAGISMIFQEPLSSLNPVFCIGNQIVDVIRAHRRIAKSAAREHAIELLARVGVPDPRRVARSYPHELSGGQRQRAMIAMALSCSPRLLIADEPTSALDVTIQAQVLDLLRSLQRDLDMSMIVVSHDLSVVGELAQRIVIMYAGMAVEEGTASDVLQHPLHPYTQALLAAIPRASRHRSHHVPIQGEIPELSDLPSGCCFAPRCREVMDACRKERPVIRDVGGRRRVRCIRR